MAASNRAAQGRRRFLRGSLALGGLLLLTGCGGSPLPWQRTQKVARIGLLARVGDDRINAFREALRELGYLEGQTVLLEERWAESDDQVPTLASELVRMPVDVIVTGGSGTTSAAMAATRVIPIVFSGAGDPVRQGYVESLARPGGNVTGTSNLQAQLQGKHLEFLRQIVPGASRVLYLTDTRVSQSGGDLRAVQQAAQLQGVELLVPDVFSAADLSAAFELAARRRVEALLVTGTPLMQSVRERVIAFATEARLPLIGQDRSFTEAGGLSSYSANRLWFYRRAAYYVDRILQGARPADLPVEQPTTFELVVNLKTARSLGLSIPQSILEQAAEIIQ